MKNNFDIKALLNSLDDDVIIELLEVSQLALNDADTLDSVSEESGIELSRLVVLAELAIELSNGQQPTITTSEEITLQAKKMSSIMG